MKLKSFLLGGAALFVLATRARADAPASQYAPFNAMATTIRDQLTLLEWQRLPLAGTWAQTQAAQQCAASTLNGQTDWRVPTYKELLTLVDEDLWLQFDPQLLMNRTKAIDRNAFTDTPVDLDYWSSTPAGASNAWFVDFSSGESGTASTLQSKYVRCVRVP